MKRASLFLAVVIAFNTIVASAHHSISGVYDTGQQLTLDGVVTQFQFVNPHPFVTIEVKQAGGVQSWKLELDNRSELVQIGMTERTLRAGDRVVVTGNPGRAQLQGLYVNRLDRPSDGFRYEQIGSTPRIRNAK